MLGGCTLSWAHRSGVKHQNTQPQKLQPKADDSKSRSWLVGKHLKQATRSKGVTILVVHPYL